MATPFRLQILAKAQHYADAKVAETPGMNNRGKEVDHFLRAVGVEPGEPWCAAFVSCCGMECHDPVLNKLAETRKWLNQNFFLCSAGVVAIMNDAKHRGLWVPKKGTNVQALPGWLVVYHFETGWHIGIVKSDEGVELEVIEGNTSDGNDRDGDGVALKQRSKKYVVGYVNLGG